ncbi:hypothetical protein PSCICN_24520 [Pseudomonas cichorii]|uniref:pilus assembly protein TadG-related protein n=1 Tax=Pseudomonas cichorii TaxID=36746 RepID=UPI0019108DFA|nr:TadE/TadG family type IV pilus assembly protein [Pseudomonas cichorii]GFM81760.1 hypothetical protein PSCICN_24520 [Pseudomonas cichorii]
MLNRRLQRGNVAPFMILATGGLLLASAYAIDVTRMTGNASQLKRATDAAALAVGRANADGDENVSKDPTGFATAYVRQNLGMDAQLLDNLGEVTVEEGRSADSNPTYRVTATSRHDPQVSGNASQDLTVHSTAELISKPLEVALAIDSSEIENAMTIGVNSKLHTDAARYFLDRLFGTDSSGQPRETKENLRVALVPFSQEVNVYDPQYSRANQPRLTEWSAPGALTPPDYGNVLLHQYGFFKRYGDLRNPQFPDRRARRLAFYRGTNTNESYDWIPSPAQSKMQVVAGMIISSNENMRAVVSERRFFTLSATNDDGVENLVDTDASIPNAPLLPLEADRSALDGRLDEIRGDWYLQVMPGLFWAGSALSPNWRGSGGWGDNTYPLDFNPDGSGPNRKAIVLLLNWNSGIATEDQNQSIQDFLDICQSFSDNGVEFHAVVRATTPLTSVPGGTSPVSIASDWLTPCTDGGKRLHVIEGNSSDTPGDLRTAFDSIANELKSQANRVLLVE